MPTAPAVELFSTSILSNHRVRHRHERYTSVLRVKQVPFIYHDLASSEAAKSRWRRKALDASIPGLLVNNEWRGTFEEFEEAVEFGELDLFLRVGDGEPLELPDEAPAQEEQSAAPAAAAPAAAAAEASTRSASHSTLQPLRGLAQPRSVSHAGPTAAPSVPLPHALPHHGARAEPSADAILAKLAPPDLELNDDDVDAMLAEIAALSVRDRERKKEAPPVEEKKEERRKGTYPELGAGAKPAVPRTYIPSASAGTAPLRLARMGSGVSMARDVSASSSSSSSSAASSTPSAAPRAARYNAAQISSRALAAEASASAASRALSTKSLARAVSDGTDLPTALQGARSEVLVGREDPDALLASLGLGELQLTEEEAEAFLESGIIPEGAASGGGRVKKGKEEKVREETAAREVASRARMKGYTGSPMESRSVFEKQRDEKPETHPETGAAGLGIETDAEASKVEAQEAPAIAVSADTANEPGDKTEPPTQVDVKTPDASSASASSTAEFNSTTEAVSALPTSTTPAETSSTVESSEASKPASASPAVAAAAAAGAEDTPRPAQKALPSEEDGQGEGSADTVLAAARSPVSAPALDAPEPIKPVTPKTSSSADAPVEALAKSSSASSITSPATPAAGKSSAPATPASERAASVPRSPPAAAAPHDPAAAQAAAAAAAAAEAEADADARAAVRLLMQGTDFGDEAESGSGAAQKAEPSSSSSVKPAALTLEPSPVIALASPGPASSSSTSPPSPKSPKQALSTRSSRSPLVSRSPISPLSTNAAAQVRRQPSDPRSPVLSPSRRGLEGRRREPGSASLTPSGSASSFSSLGALHSPVGASPRSVSSPVTGNGGISRSASSESKKGRFSLAGMLNSSKSDRGDRSASASNASGSPVSLRSPGATRKEERASKTLSQILREADAAMADEEEEEEELADGDDMAWEGEDVKELRI